MILKPLPPLTRLLLILLKVDIGILIMSVIGGIYGWFEYSRLDQGTDVSETLFASDVLNLCVAIVQMLMAVFLGVTFLRWVHRANKNLHELSPGSMTFSPGWSVGWYFIPIANLIKPYQAMKEIWFVAHRQSLSKSSILGWWWALWIASNILSRLAMKSSLRAEDAQGYASSALIDAVSSGFDIILDLAALLLVTSIAKAYDTNYNERAMATAGDPALSISNTAFADGPESTN